MTITYIGIGSNIGTPIENVETAILDLHAVGNVLRQSSLYRTKPWGYKDQPDFINAVVMMETHHQPLQLLDALLAIEKKAGRQRLFKNAPRILDLDILLFGDQKVAESQLIIPHPQMIERAFVLVPLVEINPDFKPLLKGLSPEQLSEVVCLSH